MHQIARSGLKHRIYGCCYRWVSELAFVSRHGSIDRHCFSSETACCGILFSISFSIKCSNYRIRNCTRADTVRVHLVSPLLASRDSLDVGFYIGGGVSLHCDWHPITRIQYPSFMNLILHSSCAEVKISSRRINFANLVGSLSVFRVPLD